MSLDVGDGVACIGGKCHGCSHLIGHHPLDLARGHWNDPATEAPQIREAWVSPDGNAALFSLSEGTGHDFWIARMKTTSDVGRADDVEDGFVVAHLPGTKALAHVRVQVNLRCIFAHCEPRIRSVVKIKLFVVRLIESAR
ncbi:hypothetical protein D3C85_1525420 [compost metagenome]